MKKSVKNMMAENKGARKRIIAFIVLIFTIISVFQTLKTQASGGVNANIFLNITAGTLTFSAGPDVALADWAFDPNAGTNSGGNLTTINVIDHRGSAAGWTVSAWSNALTATNTAGVPFKNTIANSLITIRGGTLAAYNSSSTTGIVVNTTNQTLSAARTIVNAGSGYGSGEYHVDTSLIIAQVDNATVAGLYGAKMSMTIA